MTRLVIPSLAFALALAGGPDLGGYRYADSDTANGPAFDWIDISVIGTRIELEDDDNKGPFPTGMTCDFYGGSYDSLQVCSNGWLSFTSGSHQFHHFPIPDDREPNSLLALLWADLDPSEGGDVYVWSSDTFGTVVSWHKVPFHGIEDSCTFQLVLRNDSSYVFNYLNLPDSPLLDSCTVGIENQDGRIGLEYLHNGLPEHNKLHDSLAIRFWRPDKDLALTDIFRPFEYELEGIQWFPTVRVHNYSQGQQSFRVTCEIPGYSETVNVPALPALTATIVEFPAMSGAGNIEFFVQLCDSFPENDTLIRRVKADTTGDLRHDDGTADTSFLRVGTPTREWGAAVKLPALPYDYRLTAARIFVLDTLPFARVLACPGDTVPDLEHPYFEAESVASALPDTWLQVPADTLVRENTPLWVVAFWTKRATGPRIGEDRSFADRYSRFGSPSLSWFRHDAGDLMMRLEVNGGTGISELGSGALRPQLYAGPNPFTTSVLVRFAGPGAGSFSGRVFDSRGRVVRSFRTASGVWGWRGTDDQGRFLPCGAYFVEVDSEAGRLRSKLLLAR
ncbi:MAG: hypothetical protein JSU73_02885 [candidate division WOR-3 bacterium]|nr:MAG: hypothetical protein JSU73_02885 [candidate division WOR-3 bacterium]